jgi:hypothetical protein
VVLNVILNRQNRLTENQQLSREPPRFSQFGTELATV